MKQMQTQGLFKEQRDAWRLGASLGIAKNQTIESRKRETFQNINSLDPESIFAAIMLGLHPDLTPKERVKKLVDYAEWGINELARQNDIGILDFTNLAVEIKTD